MAQVFVGGAMQVWKAIVCCSAFFNEILTRLCLSVNEPAPTEADQAHVSDERHLEKLTVHFSNLKYFCIMRICLFMFVHIYTLVLYSIYLS